MPLCYIRNPMYALCLLAAVCVRDHVQSHRVEQPLTKGVSFQTPTSGLTKPNEVSLKIITDSREKYNNELLNRKKNINIQEADSLVYCVQNFAKRTRRFVEDIRSTIPVTKSSENLDPLASSNILDSLLYLTSNVGIKWLA